MRTLASLVVAGLLLAWSSPASGQASEMAGKAFGDSTSKVDSQITSASKQVEDALKAFATRGKSTAAGVSGAVTSMLIDSDTIICASWLMAFEITMKDLAGKGAFNSDEGAALMQALLNLKNRVEAACQQVLNNEDPPRNAGPTDGTTQSGTCPECDALKDAYDTAKYRADRAKFLHDRAKARADAAYEMAATQPALYKLLYLSTPQELEADEDAKADALARAEKIRATAHRAYLDCLEACHKRTRTQVGFWDSTRNKTAVGVAAVAVGVLAFTAGGGGTPTAVVSTPSPTPIVVVPPTPPVIITPIPGPEVPAPPPAPVPFLSLLPGAWDAESCLVLEDVDRHDEAELRACAEWMRTSFQVTADGVVVINHPGPWVLVSGNVNETTGAYRATGVGRFRSFSNVSSTVTGTFQRSGDATATGDLTVAVGENGVFPGGRPAKYGLRLRKRR